MIETYVVEFLLVLFLFAFQVFCWLSLRRYTYYGLMMTMSVVNVLLLLHEYGLG